MELNNNLRNRGFLAFFLSGICAISSGVIVSILKDNLGFAYSITGTLLSFMNIGNMTASFMSGILPSKIGLKKTVLILCSGYFLGYLLMSFTGIIGVLMLAFLFVGIAKGCALNNCTVLVGENSKDRSKSMSLMHALYALGALLCPFIIMVLQRFGKTVPMIGIGLIGLLLWFNFLTSGLKDKTKDNEKKKKKNFDFLKSPKFWLITALIFCQNGAETAVTGWMVTYYKSEAILSGLLSTYTVTIMWGATLVARLLIAFVFPVKNTFKTLTFMGISCAIMYGLMIFAGTPTYAILMLFLFAFSMAGVNPIAIAGVGKIMSNESMGVLLPIGGIGAIVMPWLIGIAGDIIGLKMAMFINLIPCIGIGVLSYIIFKMENQ